MASTLKQSNVLQEQILRTTKLAFDVAITGNATPASKTYTTDIPGIVILRAQGETTVADAADSSITWTSPADNSSGNSTFGLLIALSNSGPDDIANKVYKVDVVSHAGHSLAVTGPSNTADAYVSTNGNIAIEVVATGLNLASASDTLHVIVSYQEVSG